VGEAGDGAPSPLQLGASPGGPHQDSLLPLCRGARPEQLQEVLEREAAATQRERAAVRWEAMVIERELAMEERSRVALELTNHAKVALKLIEE
jgi:hypothetical protein